MYGLQDFNLGGSPSQTVASLAYVYSLHPTLLHVKCVENSCESGKIPALAKWYRTPSLLEDQTVKNKWVFLKCPQMEIHPDHLWMDASRIVA